MINRIKEAFLIDVTYNKHYAHDVILVAGQSNAEGYGRGDAQHLYQPHLPVFGYNGQGGITLARDKKYGRGRGANRAASFATYFAEEYVKHGCLKSGRAVLVLNAAVGGTGFSDHRWGAGEDLSERFYFLMDKILHKDAQNRLISVLWHQGETDSNHHMPEQQYYENLKLFIDTVRQKADNAGLPFISGNMSPSWMHENPYSFQIAEAQRRLMIRTPYCAFVESEGLDGNPRPDHIHFSRKSCAKLGKRYFEQYLAIMQKKHPESA